MLGWKDGFALLALSTPDGPAMRTLTRLVLPTALLLTLGSLLHAQTSYPMITHTTPVAVQRGKTTEVLVQGQQNFFGVYHALFQGTGIKAEGLPATPPSGPIPATPVRSVKVKLTVAADAAPGVRDFRLVSSLGLSSIGQILVVDDPVIEEKAENNTLEKATKVPVPCVVSGRVELAEDVDYYAFEVQAGQTLTFEVQGARLEDKIHDLQKHLDPKLTLFDATGRELADNDDFYFADPLLSYTFTRAGTYYIQVRDSKYDGDPRWVYALALTSAPYVSHLYPLAVAPGQTVQVEPVGSASLVQARVALTAPRELGLHEVPLQIKGKPTNRTALMVSELPQVLEQEPNDTPKQAQRVQVPCGINGRIATPRELDHFVFKGTKGKAIRMEMHARRFGTVLQSSLDGVLDILTLDGKVLASSDDTYGKDPGLVFTPPADLDYVIRIRDLNSKGAPSAVYFLELDWATPDFTLRCDPDKAMIGPGSSAAWFVHVTRVNGFQEPVTIEIKNLPRGVTASPLTIPPTMTQGVVVLTANAQAPLGVSNVTITGTATWKGAEGKSTTLTRAVTPNQEIYLPGGGRGRFDVEMQTVAVTLPSDILKVDVTPRQIRLKPGQEVKLEVNVVRRADYNKPISLDILLRHLGSVYGNPLPPGVTIVEGKSKTLLGTASKGHLVLKAAPNAAPIENVPLSVLTHVSINFVVKVSYSSEPILLTVEK